MVNRYYSKCYYICLAHLLEFCKLIKYKLFINYLCLKTNPVEEEASLFHIHIITTVRARVNEL